MTVQIETNRIILKNYCENDLYNISRLKSDPLIWKFSSKKATDSIEESKKHLENILNNYLEKRNDFQALFLKETKEFIGEAGILSFNRTNNRAVIGYNLLPIYWDNGYATEITKALVKYLFEKEKVERIEALAADKNKASKRVLEKSGFIQEGLLRNFAYIENKYIDVCYYGMISYDYLMKQKQV